MYLQTKVTIFNDGNVCSLMVNIYFLNTEGRTLVILTILDIA